jgi:hypothetical protein
MVVQMGYAKLTSHWCDAGWRMIMENDTLIERKLRMLQIQGAKGEAVVCYCEPLTTQEIGYHRLSQRVNKMKI